MSSPNTTEVDSGQASTSQASTSTPSKISLGKRQRKNPEDDSPIKISSTDLSKKLGSLQPEFLAATMPNTKWNLDKLNRLLITARFTIRTLQEIRKLVKEVANGDGPTGVETNSQQKMKLGSISPKKQSSPSADCLSEIHLSVATFLGVARSEITLCIKANTTQPISPTKEKRLHKLLDAANYLLTFAEEIDTKIQDAIKKVDQNHELKPNLMLSDFELKVIHMLRTKVESKKSIQQILNYHGITDDIALN